MPGCTRIGCLLEGEAGKVSWAGSDQMLEASGAGYCHFQ